MQLSIEALLLVIYIAFNLYLLLHHEQWRDEANVWLMGRELSLVELFREIKYQGHPCLWYLIVMPFAKLQLPFETIGILSLLVMSGAVGVFLIKGRCSLILKALVIFSPFFTYFYSVVARNYCLIPITLMLLAWLHKDRWKHSLGYGLLLGLLVQEDIIAVPIAGIISLWWLCEGIRILLGNQLNQKEKKQKMVRLFGGLLIPLFSLFALFLQLRGVSESTQFGIQDLGLSDTIIALRDSAYGLICRITGWNRSVCIAFYIVMLLMLVWISVLKKNLWPTMVFISTWLFQVIFSALVYQLHMWHYLILGAVALWTVWLYLDDSDYFGKGKLIGYGKYGVQIMIGVLCIAGFCHWNSEAESSSLKGALYGVYSGGKDAARFIRENMDKEDIIISTDVAFDSTILAYLPGYTFIYAGTLEKESYADWTEKQMEEISVPELMQNIHEVYPEKDKVYLILTENNCLYDREYLEKLERIYVTPEKTIREENYTIYRVYGGK